MLKVGNAPLSWGVFEGNTEDTSEWRSDDCSLRPVLNPRYGTHIEFLEEIDRALRDLSSAPIGLYINTGHSPIVGMRACELAERSPACLEHLHLKAVDATALRRMNDEGLDFDEALGVGLCRALGQEIVDFTSLRETLVRVRFSGVAKTEQDPDLRVAGHGGLEAAQQSIGFLQALGLADDAQRPVPNSQSAGGSGS